MYNLRNKVRHLQTLSQSHLKGEFHRAIFILCIILAFFSGDIANFLYEKYQIEPWLFTINLLRFDFLLMIFLLRVEVKKLIGPLLYRIVVYILINNFIDRYFGIIGWSWNDYITILVVVLDFVLQKYFKKWK